MQATTTGWLHPRPPDRAWCLSVSWVTRGRALHGGHSFSKIFPPVKNKIIHKRFLSFTYRCQRSLGVPLDDSTGASRPLLLSVTVFECCHGPPEQTQALYRSCRHVTQPAALRCRRRVFALLCARTDVQSSSTGGGGKRIRHLSCDRHVTKMRRRRRAQRSFTRHSLQLP